MELRKILVPTDFSPYAERALKWAASLAGHYNAEILLLHVLPDTATIWGSEPVQELTRLRTKAEARLKDDATSLQDCGKTVTVLAVSGQPFHEICAVATQYNVDLIVMGTHGRSGLSHVLLGSVAERVVRHAPCPVLTVR